MTPQQNKEPAKGDIAPSHRTKANTPEARRRRLIWVSIGMVLCISWAVANFSNAFFEIQDDLHFRQSWLVKGMSSSTLDKKLGKPIETFEHPNLLKKITDYRTLMEKGYAPKWEADVGDAHAARIYEYMATRWLCFFDSNGRMIDYIEFWT